MLIQFSVENYKSIRDELIINFRADKKYEDSKWVVNDTTIGMPIYKCVGLLGPNASGKSNIIDALYFALKFIYRTISRKENEHISVKSFSFSEECREMPTSFEFIFVHRGIKYVYGFSITVKEVIEEYLLGYFSAKPKTIFERARGQKYDFKGNNVKQQKEIAQKTNANRLYMPVAAEWGYEPAKRVSEWFDKMVRQYMFNITDMLREIISDTERKEFFLRELQKADFNIVDIYIKGHKLDKKMADMLQKLMSSMGGEVSETAKIDERQEIRVVHRNEKGVTFDIALSDDSSGTESIVQNMAEIMHIGQIGGLMLEDELGENFHTRLTQHFLDIIKSDKINSGNAQVFFSSHDTKVLNALNYDQVYLVDKDEDGATFVTLLDDFQIRPETNVELGYLKGKFGGVPYMRG